MRPFGCLITILNTIDHLGKFDRKADEGFFVGYSTNSKAFRVFNSRTRIVEENLHVQFSENTPNIAGSGPNWLFDIDSLTKSMNYKTVVLRNQSNGSAGTKACDDANKASMEIVPGKDYILLPVWPADPLFSQSSKDSSDARFKPSREEEKKDAEDPGKESGNPTERKDSEVPINVVDPKTSIELLNDPNMPELEDIVYSDDDEDIGAEADMNNLDAFMHVSPIPTIRIHKDHPVEQIIKDLHSAPQIRRMTKNLKEHGLFSLVQQRTNHKDFQNCLFACFLAQEEPKKVIQALKDLRYTQEEGIDYDEVFAPVAILEANRLFLAYASFKEFMVYQMDVKSAFLYGKIEEEVYICQPPGFEDPDFPDRRGKIDKTLFIKRDKGDILLVQVYVDDIIFSSTKKSLCTEFEKMMHKKFQMSSMSELIFFLGLQVNDVKTASTPMETHKPLLEDADSEDVDEHLYRSMIGSLMYLTSSRPNIMFAVCQPKLGLWYPKDSSFDLVAYIDNDYVGASLDRKSTTGGCQFLGCRLISWQCKKQTVVASSTTKAEYIVASNCCGQISISDCKRDLQLEDVKGTECLPTATIFEELTRMRYEKLTQKLTFYKAFFSPQWKFLIHTILQCLSAKTTAWKEFSSTMASVIISLATNQNFNFSKYILDSMVKNMDSMVKFWMYPRKDTEVSQPSGPTEPMADETENVESVPTHSNDPQLSGEDSLKLNELMELCTHLQKKVLDLDTSKTTQALEVKSLKGEWRSLRISENDEASLDDQEDASKQGRKFLDIDADEDITLDSTHFDIDLDIFGVHDLHDDEVFVETQEPTTTSTILVSVATATTTKTVDELTLVQTLIEIKAAKPKEKGKAKMTEPEKPLKKKDQIMYDQEGALNLQAQLQAELEEEEKLSRQKEEKAKIALIEL
ncbi:putative ribonuclease H-like domain-containing protein [Tanacetum coccineum]